MKASLILVLLLVGLGVVMWALIDAATTPTQVFRTAGQSKAMWMALIGIFFVLIEVVGVVLAVVYLASIRPKLRRSVI